jgi:hypothetical protein
MYPRIEMVTSTGSPATGREVLAAGAATRKKTFFGLPLRAHDRMLAKGAHCPVVCNFLAWRGWHSTSPGPPRPSPAPAWPEPPRPPFAGNSSAVRRGSRPQPDDSHSTCRKTGPGRPPGRSCSAGPATRQRTPPPDRPAEKGRQPNQRSIRAARPADQRRPPPGHPLKPKSAPRPRPRRWIEAKWWGQLFLHYPSLWPKWRGCRRARLR